MASTSNAEVLAPEEGIAPNHNEILLEPGIAPNHNESVL